MDQFEQAARTVRFLAIDAVEKANSGHPGAPMALADIGVDIYARTLRYNPQDPAWPNRDRFVLSCGHASMLLYGLLFLAGYDLTVEDLKQFRQWGSKTSGHPEVGLTPGVETTTGPLGQGFGNAVGMALAAKLMAARVNTEDTELINYRVFVLASDGDLMEGVTQEAASLAGHLGLDNLVVVYDDNHITIDGTTEASLSDDPIRRFESLGWFAERADGHDRQAFRAALDRAIAEPGRPSLIAARTVIARGAPTKENTSASHGAPLGADEAEGTKRAAGWPLEPKFYVPDGAREAFAARVADNQKEYQAWYKMLEALPTDRMKVWQSFASHQAPEDLLEQLLSAAESKAEATRNLASAALQRTAELVPALIGGSADLACSVKSRLKTGGDVKRDDFSGRNLHFGVREHGMAAVCTGLALSGFFIPYATTFMVFSDYLRPSLRLAAMMKLQVVYLFSHDSVFVGEDGPTHQPLEHLTALRIIPNLDVVRPADASETAAAWAYALGRREGPTVIATARQKTPPLPRSESFDAQQLLEGAYVLADAPSPALVIIATGSEVHVALETQQILAQKGIATRVVSAPCWQRFERQSPERQAEIVPPGVRRVAVEAGLSTLWRAVVGLDGLVIGLDDFGASAPAERLQREYGLTGAQIAERIQQWL